MTTGIPPLDILLTKGQYVFAFDFGRYIIAASLTFCVVWLLRRSAVKARKIQAREATVPDMRRELFQSLQSSFYQMAESEVNVLQELRSAQAEQSDSSIRNNQLAHHLK